MDFMEDVKVKRKAPKKKKGVKPKEKVVESAEKVKRPGEDDPNYDLEQANMEQPEEVFELPRNLTITPQ
jgi:hypothetical protein